MLIINYVYVPHKILATETNKSNATTTILKLYKLRKHQKAFMCAPS